MFSMQLKYIVLLLCLLPVFSFAQIGGENTYEFLNLTNSARMSALGGNQVGLADPTDPNVAYNNPALLSDGMKHRLTVNYTNYISDVNYGYVAYVLPFRYRWPLNFSVGVHYINYGKFIEALSDGTKTGSTFNAAEYAFLVSCSYAYKQFSLGVTAKPVLSSFETYQSTGVAADIGLCYKSEDNLFSAGFVVRNLGRQLTPYYDGGEIEPLPTDYQVGIAKQFGYAPVLLALTLQHLQEWELAKAEEVDNGYTTTTKKDNFGKKVLRHAVFGVEIMPSDNLTFRVGYNYQRRQELKFDEKQSTAGFSWGFSFQKKRFLFSYGSARYHLAGSSNTISVAMNFGNTYYAKRKFTPQRGHYHR